MQLQNLFWSELIINIGGNILTRRFTTSIFQHSKKPAKHAGVEAERRTKREKSGFIRLSTCYRLVANSSIS